MSLNIRSYLEDLDREIFEYRQQICQLQVLIQQREDVRATMMQREEMRAARNGQASPFGTLPHGGQIVFRERPALAAESIGLAALSAPAQADDPVARRKERQRLREHTPQRRNYKREYERRRAEERRQALEKYGTDDASVKQRPPRSDKGQPKDTSGYAKPGRHRHYMPEILALFSEHPERPLMSREIAAELGATSKQDKQAVFIALYELKKQDKLAQTQQREPYTLVRKAPEPSDERFGDHVTGFEP